MNYMIIPIGLFITGVILQMLVSIINLIEGTNLQINTGLYLMLLGIGLYVFSGRLSSSEVKP